MSRHSKPVLGNAAPKPRSPGCGACASFLEMPGPQWIGLHSSLCHFHQCPAQLFPSFLSDAFLDQPGATLCMRFTICVCVSTSCLRWDSNWRGSRTCTRGTHTCGTKLAANRRARIKVSRISVFTLALAICCTLPGLATTTRSASCATRADSGEGRKEGATRSLTIPTGPECREKVDIFNR